MGVCDLWVGRQNCSKQTLVVHFTEVLQENFDSFFNIKISLQVTACTVQPVKLVSPMEIPFPAKVRTIWLLHKRFLYLYVLVPACNFSPAAMNI